MDLPEHWDAEAVQDAVDVLQDVVLWDLAPARWVNVQRAMQRMHAAIESGDVDELRDATNDMENGGGPVRQVRIGTNMVTGVPPQILERRNELVHALTGEPVPEPVTRSVPEEGHDDQRPR
jgi:hypothetical protein